MTFKITKQTHARLISLATKASEQLAAIGNVRSELNGTLTELAVILSDERDQAQSDFDDKSETWQEGDRGSAVADWITRLDELVDNVEALPETDDLEEIENFMPEIEDLETEPSF